MSALSHNVASSPSPLLVLWLATCPVAPPTLPVFTAEATAATQRNRASIRRREHCAQAEATRVCQRRRVEGNAVDGGGLGGGGGATSAATSDSAFISFTSCTYTGLPARSNSRGCPRGTCPSGFFPNTVDVQGLCARSFQDLLGIFCDQFGITFVDQYSDLLCGYRITSGGADLARHHLQTSSRIALELDPTIDAETQNECYVSSYWPTTHTMHAPTPTSAHWLISLIHHLPRIG